MVETTTTAKVEIPTEPEKPDEFCIVDLGQQSRRRIKHLRRGHGRLMHKIQNAIDALKEEGVVEAAGPMLVVLVREKPTLASLFEDDDDDDDYDDDDDD